MDTSFILRIVLLALLLAFSAFFSGSETAFYSLNSLERDALRRRAKGPRVGFVQLLLDSPDEVLITILTGNMLVNIVATFISDSISAELFGDASEIVSIVGMTAILLMFGEMTPKNVAIRHSLRFAHASAYPMAFLQRFLRPMVAFLNWVRRAVLSLSPKVDANTEDTKNIAVLSAIRVAYEHGNIQESELKLLETFFEFRQQSAADVLIPRIELPAVDTTATVEEALRIPVDAEERNRKYFVAVYRETIDDIVGYALRKDLLLWSVREQPNIPITEVQKPVHTVPESLSLPALLREMERQDVEVVVAIDEYGGTSGVVTYQTVVEALFDEFFPTPAQEIIPSGVGTYLIAGSMELDDLREYFGVEVESESRTVAGLVIEQLEQIPPAGTSLRVDGLELTIRRVEEHRIVEIEVRKTP